MKEEKESKVIAEVRRIRRKIQEEARKVGRDEYYGALNRKRGFFLRKRAKCADPAPSEALGVRERPKPKYGEL